MTCMAFFSWVRLDLRATICDPKRTCASTLRYTVHLNLTVQTSTDRTVVRLWPPDAENKCVHMPGRVLHHMGH